MEAQIAEEPQIRANTEQTVCRLKCPLPAKPPQISSSTGFFCRLDTSWSISHFSVTIKLWAEFLGRARKSALKKKLFALGLSCSMQGLVPWTEIERWSPRLGARSLRHWTRREVPRVLLESRPIVSGGLRSPLLGGEHLRCWTSPLPSSPQAGDGKLLFSPQARDGKLLLTSGPFQD